MDLVFIPYLLKCTKSHYLLDAMLEALIFLFLFTIYCIVKVYGTKLNDMIISFNLQIICFSSVVNVTLPECSTKKSKLSYVNKDYNIFNHSICNKPMRNKS